MGLENEVRPMETLDLTTKPGQQCPGLVVGIDRGSRLLRWPSTKAPTKHVTPITWDWDNSQEIDTQD